MPDNRYVREIKLFNPNRDLAVDDLHPSLSHKRPPVNPSEGLLDDDDEDEYVGGPAPAARPAARKPSGRTAGDAQPVGAPPPAAVPEPAAPASASAPAAPAPASSSADAVPLEGDIPDIIEGDFPEPIDL